MPITIWRLVLITSVFWITFRAAATQGSSQETALPIVVTTPSIIGERRYGDEFLVSRILETQMARHYSGRVYSRRGPLDAIWVSTTLRRIPTAGGWQIEMVSRSPGHPSRRTVLAGPARTIIESALCSNLKIGCIAS